MKEGTWELGHLNEKTHIGETAFTIFWVENFKLPASLVFYMGLFDGLFGSKKTVGEELKENLEKKSPVTSGSGSGVFFVQDVFDIKGVGIIVVGQVQSGAISPGNRAQVSGKTAQIATIEAHHQRKESARAGENVGLNLKGINKNDVKKGDVLNFVA